MPKEDVDSLSIVAHTAADIASLVKGVTIPGVDFGVAVVQVAFQARARKRAHRFFTDLAVALGCDDGAAAARHVAAHIDKEWAQEAVERGYRLMMSSIDDVVRPCIAGLIAEYLIEKKSPDREFQRVGALLADCVAPDLRILNCFCDLVVEIFAASIVGPRAFVRGDKQSNISLTVPIGQDKPFRTASFGGSPDEEAAAIARFIRHGFGQGWTGMASVSALGGGLLLEFTPREDAAYLLLRRCLLARRT